MTSDFWIVLRWWGTLFLVGAAAYPVTSLLFSRWPAGNATRSDAGWYDRGYAFSKAVGMAITGWIVYVAGMARLLPFTAWTVWVAVAAVFVIGVVFHRVRPSSHKLRWELIVTEELLFLAALIFWSWIKAHEPTIRSLEKFMDYGFMNSILHSTYFPPPDMWYPPYPINYYYFGHLVTAVLTRLSGLDLSYTFNLMLATIFALCLTMSFSIAYTLIRGMKGMRRFSAVLGASLTAFLTTLAGNMQTIYAFTKGYDADKVVPFWTILWSAGEFLSKVGDGMARYWYANATRFIPYTIHEFPGYSFVVSDVHGHVLSIPFVLLTVALLIVFFADGIRDGKQGGEWSVRSDWPRLVFYGFLVGVLLMTNALDGPVYFGLFLFLLLVLYPGDWREGKYWKETGIIAGVVGVSAFLTSLPFLSRFTSFVNGVAVNCPPAALQNSRIGPILFETVDKCQKSPLWMLWLLWGFFWFNGISLALSVLLRGYRRRKGTFFRRVADAWRTEATPVERMLLIWFVFSTLLIIFPEFFYFKDIYPMHFRSNTMFKLGYQAFILYSVISGYTIWHIIRGLRKSIWNRVFLVLLLPQLFLVSIYPWFSIRGYFGNLDTYRGLWGIEWLAREYPDNYAAAMWLNTRPRTAGPAPVILEADGDSYTDYNQMSVFGGMPTVVGWAVHEWLWRGSYDAVSPRREDVRMMYETEDMARTRELLAKYRVSYVVVGTMEREKFTSLSEAKFSLLGQAVFRQGKTVIYDVSRAQGPLKTSGGY